MLASGISPRQCRPVDLSFYLKSEAPFFGFQRTLGFQGIHHGLSSTEGLYPLSVGLESTMRSNPVYPCRAITPGLSEPLWEPEKVDGKVRRGGWGGLSKSKSMGWGRGSSGRA
jgi:hypothetical protein